MDELIQLVINLKTAKDKINTYEAIKIAENVKDFVLKKLRKEGLNLMEV